jgi:hypothetical protein
MAPNHNIAEEIRPILLALFADGFPLGKCFAQSEEDSPQTSVLVGIRTPTFRKGLSQDY